MSHNTDPLEVPPTGHLFLDEERTQRGLDRIKPRQVDSNARCPDCKSPDRNPMIPPMAHPRHRWAPCQFANQDGTLCGCTSARGS